MLVMYDRMSCRNLGRDLQNTSSEYLNRNVCKGCFKVHSNLLEFLSVVPRSIQAILICL